MLLFRKIKTIVINNKILFVFIILLVIISSICVFKIIENNQNSKEEEKLITSFFDLNKELPKDTNSNESKKEESARICKQEEYAGVLQIPSINLQRGFYNKYSKKNTVNIGLEVISESQMPNIENSELVIAGHSGNGYLAFFQELNKVEKGSLIYIFYEGIKYTYKLEKTTITDKDGEISVEKDVDSQTLILTTCNPSNRDNEQLILISKLIKKEKYRNGE